MITVGQKIYGKHNSNKRFWKDEGLPEGWAEYEVVGETKVSWLVTGNGYMTIKVDKKTMLERQKDYIPIVFVATLEDVSKQEFIDNHKLVDKIRVCKDYDKLKAIEAILE